MKKYFVVIISSKVSHIHIGTVRVCTAIRKRQLMETRFVQVLESWICYGIDIHLSIFKSLEKFGNMV